MMDYGDMTNVYIAQKKKREIMLVIFAPQAIGTGRHRQSMELH